MKKITLEDNGQDFLEFITDDEGIILEARPFQTSIWEGGLIPIKFQEIGKECMMHKPPTYMFGFLKHKVLSIENFSQTL